jgi:hypothetical protein
MYLRVVGLCDKCGEWREDIVTDCEQRKQELIVAKIKAAMEILEQSPCGAVGKRGMNREELSYKLGANLSYQAAQSAWLELNELLEAIT